MISRTGNNSEGAFTLLELVLVVLILAVLTGLSAPMFRETFRNMQIAQSCSDLAAVLNYARQSAVFDRAEHSVRISPDEAKFWIEPDGKVHTLPKGVSILSPKERITFYPNGRAEAINISLSNNIKKYTLISENTARFIKIRQE